MGLLPLVSWIRIRIADAFAVYILPFSTLSLSISPLARTVCHHNSLPVPFVSHSLALSPPTHVLVVMCCVALVRPFVVVDLAWLRLGNISISSILGCC